MKTLLIEKQGFLGGTATTSLVPIFMGIRPYGGILKEVVDRLLQEKSAVVAPLRDVMFAPFDIEAFKFLAFDMVEEADVQLLLHSLVVDVVIAENSLQGVIVESKSGRYAILGKVIIDASGDADVAWKAGVPTQKGDENGRMQPLSMIFRVGNVDAEALGAFARKVGGKREEFKFYLPQGWWEDAKKRGEIKSRFAIEILPVSGAIVVNTSRSSPQTRSGTRLNPDRSVETIENRSFEFLFHPMMNET